MIKSVMKSLLSLFWSGLKTGMIRIEVLIVPDWSLDWSGLKSWFIRIEAMINLDKKSWLIRIEILIDRDCIHDKSG